MSTLDVIHFAFWFSITFVATKSTLKIVRLGLYNGLVNIQRNLRRKRRGTSPIERLAAELEGQPGVAIGAHIRRRS